MWWIDQPHNFGMKNRHGIGKNHRVSQEKHAARPRSQTDILLIATLGSLLHNSACSIIFCVHVKHVLHLAAWERDKAMRMEGPARLRCRCFHAEVNMYMQPSPSLLARDIFSVMQLWSSLPSFSISLSRDMTEKSGMITLEELFLPSLTPCGYLCLKNIGPSCWRPCSLVSLSFPSLTSLSSLNV
jgi:hypothetical protein